MLVRYAGFAAKALHIHTYAYYHQEVNECLLF